MIKTNSDSSEGKHIHLSNNLIQVDYHPLKYHNYCKYHDIHLVGYNSVVKLKLQNIIPYVKKF